MSQVMPSEIVDEVRSILAAARRGKGSRPNFLTAYQILNRLDEPTRARLIAERSAGGSGAGTFFAAPSVVSKAARLIPGIEIEYLDAGGLSATVGAEQVVPSYDVCGLYRLAPADEDVA